MDLTPSSYLIWGNVIRKYSGQVIDNIKKQNECYSYVLDIGSGLGNISSKLFENLNTEHLIGVDVDQRMVNYANGQNSNENIKFILQDISLDWNSLTPEIKCLEGKFNLIFSSFAMHFISNRTNTAKNISKLLAPGGQLHAVVFCLTDSLNTDKNDNSLPIVIPSAQKQMSLWTSAFEQAGLKIEHANLFKFEEAVPYATAETYYQAVCSSYETFMNEKTEVNTRRNVINLAKEKLMDISHKFIGDVNGTLMVRTESDIYTLKVIKPFN